MPRSWIPIHTPLFWKAGGGFPRIPMHLISTEGARVHFQDINEQYSICNLFVRFRPPADYNRIRLLNLMHMKSIEYCGRVEELGGNDQLPNAVSIAAPSGSQMWKMAPEMPGGRHFVLSCCVPAKLSAVVAAVSIRERWGKGRGKKDKIKSDSALCNMWLDQLCGFLSYCKGQSPAGLLPPISPLSLPFLLHLLHHHVLLLAYLECNYKVIYCLGLTIVGGDNGAVWLAQCFVSPSLMERIRAPRCIPPAGGGISATGRTPTRPTFPPNNQPPSLYPAPSSSAIKHGAGWRTALTSRNNNSPSDSFAFSFVWIR